jgi:hypothetical protein
VNLGPKEGTSAVYPTARLAIWPGRQYTNLIFIPQASRIVIAAAVMDFPNQRLFPAILISKFE